eukprot:275821-Rhodomonas_salina.1
MGTQAEPFSSESWQHTILLPFIVEEGEPDGLFFPGVSGLLVHDPCTQSQLASQGRWPHPHSRLGVAGALPPLTVPDLHLGVAGVLLVAHSP